MCAAFELIINSLLDFGIDLLLKSTICCAEKNIAIRCVFRVKPLLILQDLTPLPTVLINILLSRSDKTSNTARNSSYMQPKT